MPISSLDLEIQAILRYGWDYIRAHPEVLNDIFANLNSEHFKRIYGDKEIARIRQWILENEIPIVNAWTLNPTRVPCMSVHIAQTQEDVKNAFMGDHGALETHPIAPRVIVPEFVPDSFDPTTGTVLVPSTVDLDAALVRPAHILHDAKDEQYLIIEIVPGGFRIDTTGEPPDMSKVTIKSFIDEGIRKRGASYLQEQVDIGIHGHADSNTVMWMYYCTVWILLRFKSVIMQRCLDLTTFTASDFKRDSQYLGENIFSRWMRISARTQCTWYEDDLPQIDTIVANVEVDTDIDTDDDE